MATLSEAAKRFIVQALACYDTPTQVAEAVKEEFGIDVPRNQVGQYDPTKVSGKDLAKKWCDLFWDTRKKFRDEVSEIPIADQAFRLRQLHRMLNDAMKRKNVVLASQLLEQAAKETGGMFTNKRELSGPGGKPMEHRTVVVDEKSVAAAVSALEDEY
ncbi:DUF2280 domain-containing protein [Alcaligenes sp. MMA]|uniref:DUF2280 domain-containing protein n=1 Tax=Alcaligenes sp. MMA TaxID=2893019 RepID=UPI001E42FE57|nr:DUF2280 domain-containing protein [Alcaligenes sp. MMA]MCC9162854.1 DUF2280 domain-containing protein [Alcaligenes sp. MMA]